MEATEPEITLDYRKFCDVVHFICANCPDADLLGKTKLHKVLYYSDMLNFLDTGTPLTGDDYIKQPFGPTARHLQKAVRDLEAEERISVTVRSYFGMSKVDFISLKDPNPNALSLEEAARVREVIDFVCRRSAKEISELSHAKPWEAVQIGERIPYFTAWWLIPDTGIDESGLSAARSEAERLFVHKA